MKERKGSGTPEKRDMKMSMMEAVKSVFHNYANFNGRARRSEYWLFTLFNSLVCFGVGILAVVFTVLDLWPRGFYSFTGSKLQAPA